MENGQYFYRTNLIYFFNNNNYKPQTTKNMSKNKTLSKTELAILLGVNKRTLNRWLKPHRNELEKLGVKPCGQIFTPGAVKYLCEVFCISLD